MEMEKSVFLFSSSIQRSQNFLFNVLGLWTWKGKRKVLKSQLLIQLLAKSSKNRNVSRMNQLLKMMKTKCKEKKCCKNVCRGWGGCKCKSALLSPFGFGTLNLPAENPELVLLKGSALKSLKLKCSLGECRNSRKKKPAPVLLHQSPAIISLWSLRLIVPRTHAILCLHDITHF